MAQILYKVKPGDTLLSVCLTWGLSHDRFMRLNPDFDYLGYRYAGELVPGELLVIGDTSNVFDRLRIEERRRSK